MNTSDYIRELTVRFLESHDNSRLFCEGIQDSFYGTIPSTLSSSHSHKLEELPISEAASIGMVTGASIFGIKSIICLQRVEFGLLAIDQLVTNASKTKYLSSGSQTSPFLLRMVIGRGWGQGPCHSQSFEALWGSIPGLEVYLPATSSDYSYIFERLEVTDSPILSLEHRWTHFTNVATKVGTFYPDSIATVFSSSYNSIIATKVAAYLARYGIHIDVIHSLCLRQYTPDLASSVIKTGRIITLDVGPVHFGYGGEVIAQLAERGVSYLVPPLRLGTPFSPASARPEEARKHFVSAESLFDALETILPALTPQIVNSRRDFLGDVIGLPPDIPSSLYSGPF
jgi:pyruvate/2-oxoglutarate/acetoin dehydrogenase E1 component